MMREVIKALFVVAIIELTLVATIMVLILTLNTEIKFLMIAFVFVSLAALITRWRNNMSLRYVDNDS